MSTRPTYRYLEAPASAGLRRGVLVGLALCAPFWAVLIAVALFLAALIHTS